MCISRSFASTSGCCGTRSCCTHSHTQRQTPEHTCPWRGATIYAECALKEVPSSPRAGSSSPCLALSFSSLSISSISLFLLLHFMNYEMCNFYTATDFLRVFHRSQCAWHLPQALAHSQLQSHPSPLQKFHSLPHGVALESQLLWSICAALCSLLMDTFSM